MSAWKCIECGYEDDERWLMCPECTTPSDWQDELDAVNAELARIVRERDER